MVIAADSRSTITIKSRADSLRKLAQTSPIRTIKAAVSRISPRYT